MIGSGTVGTGCILELTPEAAGGWLKPGDSVELSIERLGTLRNRVVTPSLSLKTSQLSVGAVVHASIPATRLDSSQAAHRPPPYAGFQGRGNLLRRGCHDSPDSPGRTAWSTTCARRHESRGSNRPARSLRISANSPRCGIITSRQGPCPARVIRSAAGSLLFGNEDVTLARCRPESAQQELFRNADADEVVFVHHGRGVLHTMFGPLAVSRFRLRRHPALHDLSLRFRSGRAGPDLLVIESTGNRDDSRPVSQCRRPVEARAPLQRARSARPPRNRARSIARKRPRS